MAREKVKLSKGGSVLAMAGRKMTVKDHGYIGVALSPKVEVKDGGRVIINPVVAMVAGLFVGVGFGLMGMLTRGIIGRQGFFGRWQMRRRMRHGMLGFATHPGESLTHSWRNLMQQ